jgi:hypothetical protein
MLEVSQYPIAWISRVPDPKGPKEGLKTRDTGKDPLTQEENDKTYDQQAGDLTGKFLFLQQAFKQ